MRAVHRFIRHRLRPAIEVGAGEHWVVARGDPRDQYTGETVTLASPAALAAVGFAFEMLPYLALELRGGTLWLHSEAQVFGTGDRYLGSLGLPIWLGQAMLCARF